jgi:iron complex outermembrane recepter protein
VKTFKTAYCTQPAMRRSLFAVSSTATGCAVLLLAAAGAARAADQAATTAAATADTDTVEEIIVTGIRKGIEDSISAKKSSSSIIEAISAEDIGKLPDASIAESIARLPGIAAQRTAGRAQTLSIRGLGPDYTMTTFNGREQATTNDNRTVEFDQYPSELVSQVKIYKTPDAAMAYQGIAGTADIETVHPLTFGKPARAVTYRREQDNMKGNVPGQPTGGDRLSLTYIDQFMDHTLGVAFGAAYNKTPYQAQTREPWGYADLPGGQPGQKIIGGDKDGVQSSYFQRTGFLGVLEYKPTDALHMVVDAYHSKFKELQTVRRMEFGTVWAGATLSTPGPLNADGRMTSGTFTNIPFLVAENYNNRRDATVDSIGWKTDYSVTDNWNLTGDLSYSKVDRHDLRLESTAGTGTNNDPLFLPAKETASFTTNGDGVTFPSTSLNYSDYNTTFLTDPGGWGGGPRRSGYLGFPSTNDEIKALKLAATRKLDTKVVNAVSVGVNYAERSKSKLEQQSILYLPAGVSHAVVPDAYRNGVVNTSFFGNPYGMINYDAYGLLNSGFWTIIDARVDTNSGSGDRIFDYTNTWKVKEKLTTAYIKFDIDTQIGSVPLTGNIGVQSQTADQKADLNRVSGIDNVTQAVIVTPVNLGTSYTDVLPSMNLNFALPYDVQLRVAAAQTVARPRMDDMAGGASLSVAQDSAPAKGTLPNGQLYYWSQSGGGNPYLKPWKANAFDLSVEKYFSTKGYVSGAVYYKSLTSYIFNQSKVVDYTGVALPTPSGNYTVADANRIGVGTVMANGHGGSVRGLELTASLPGETFTPVLEGFGMIVSAAWNRSAINPTGQKVEPLPGLSPRVINSTLYYEKYGFSVRVSNRYRGEELGEVPQFDSSLTKKIVKSESLIDAQIGYEFMEGTLKGLTLNLSGTNLTNTPFVLYDVGTPAFNVLKYEKYGAVYAGTISYRF